MITVGMQQRIFCLTLDLSEYSQVSLRQYLATKNPLQTIKNIFCVTLKAPFIF